MITSLCCKNCGYTHVGHYNQIPGACDRFEPETHEVSQETMGVDANGDILEKKEAAN